MMGPNMYGQYGMIGMFFSFLFSILLIVGVVLLVVWIVRKAARDGRGHGAESALDILKKRYAQGEITKEEFDKMKKDIL